MIKNKKILIAAVLTFIITEMTLGILLQVIMGRASELVSYTAVVLACLFCVLFAERSKSYLFTQTALICTVCADYFLVYSEEMRQLPAMVFFSITQICYFLRLYFQKIAFEKCICCGKILCCLNLVKQKGMEK